MTGARIVSIGECMVEMAPQPDGRFVLGFAGDTFNTAWYLRQLLPRAPIAYLTAVGGDAISEKMTRFIAAQAIDTTFVQRVAGATVGLYLIELTGAERSFSYWRDQSAARRLARDAGFLRRAVEGADLIFVSGITLAILPEADREQLLAVLADARALGTTLAFDPNLRPALWADVEMMRLWIERMGGLADIVLPSFEEEARAFGDPAPDLTAKRYLGLGAGLVVVKNGAQDLVARDRRNSWRHSPRPPEALIDTTAAGDSFNAGFLAGYLGKAALPAALALGSEVARQVISRHGALVPLTFVDMAIQAGP